MKLTSQEEYGLRCLLRVGRAAPGASLTIAELARARGDLRAQRRQDDARAAPRRLRELHARTGGRLHAVAARRARSSWARSLAALGGRLYEPAFCEGHSGLERSCTHMPDCSIRSVWRLVQRAVDQVLGKITLKDLLKSEPEMNAFRQGDMPTLPTYSPQA